MTTGRTIEERRIQVTENEWSADSETAEGKLETSNRFGLRTNPSRDKERCDYNGIIHEGIFVTSSSQQRDRNWGKPFKASEEVKQNWFCREYAASFFYCYLDLPSNCSVRAAFISVVDDTSPDISVDHSPEGIEPCSPSYEECHFQARVLRLSDITPQKGEDDIAEIAKRMAEESKMLLAKKSLGKRNKDFDVTFRDRVFGPHFNTSDTTERTLVLLKPVDSFKVVGTKAFKNSDNRIPLKCVVQVESYDGSVLAKYVSWSFKLRERGVEDSKADKPKRNTSSVLDDDSLSLSDSTASSIISSKPKKSKKNNGSPLPTIPSPVAPMLEQLSVPGPVSSLDRIFADTLPQRIPSIDLSPPLASYDASVDPFFTTAVDIDLESSTTVSSGYADSVGIDALGRVETLDRDYFDEGIMDDHIGAATRTIFSIDGNQGLISRESSRSNG
jgi:hypothetical protein